jgi:hypothetical protein
VIAILKTDTDCNAREAFNFEGLPTRATVVPGVLFGLVGVAVEI